jgi:Putative prokaryotic signal transducing protein
MRHDILDDFDFDDEAYFNAEAAEGELIARFYAPVEAQLAAARLRAEGIPCFLANADMAQSVMPHLQILVRLHVREQDAARARTILAEASIDTEPLTTTHNGILTLMAVAIGVLLAILLVKSMYL